MIRNIQATTAGRRCMMLAGFGRTDKWTEASLDLVDAAYTVIISVKGIISATKKPRCFALLRAGPSKEVVKPFF